MNQNCRFLNVALQHQWSYKIINITAHPAQCLVFSVISLARSAYLFRRNFSFPHFYLLKNKQQEYFFGLIFFYISVRTASRWCILCVYAECHFHWRDDVVFLTYIFGESMRCTQAKEYRHDIYLFYLEIPLTFDQFVVFMFCVYFLAFFLLLSAVFFYFGKAISDAVSKMQSEEKR